MPELSTSETQQGRHQKSLYRGGGTTCGIRAKRQQVCSTQERLALRHAFSDFLRERGQTLRVVRKPTPTQGATRNAPLTRQRWQPRYLAALERTGDPEEACRRAGAVLETVQRAQQASPELHAKCRDAVAKYTLRVAERAQRRTRLQEGA